MSTKSLVLAYLEKNKGTYISGQKIAQDLKVTRAAIWKAMGTLKKQGYIIDAVSNKGYCLSANSDIVSDIGIRNNLFNFKHNIEIEVVDTISSTSKVVKEKAEAGKSEGYLLIANEQTQGIGRFNRPFVSPKDSGIYFSLLLRPNNIDAFDAIKITTIAAVGVCRAIEKVSDKKACIKWVNDIFIDNKKVSGILTEASFDIENSQLKYVIVGIGINVYKPQNNFNSNLKDVATYIFEDKQNDIKNSLIASFLEEFYKIYERLPDNDYIKEYKKRSFIIGQDVYLLKNNQKIKVHVLDIDDNCYLKIQNENKKIEKVNSGEVSVRLK